MAMHQHRLPPGMADVEGRWCTSRSSLTQAADMGGDPVAKPCRSNPAAHHSFSIPTSYAQMDAQIGRMCRPRVAGPIPYC